MRCWIQVREIRESKDQQYKNYCQLLRDNYKGLANATAKAEHLEYLNARLKHEETKLRKKIDEQMLTIQDLSNQVRAREEEYKSVHQALSEQDLEVCRLESENHRADTEIRLLKEQCAEVEARHQRKLNERDGDASRCYQGMTDFTKLNAAIHVHYREASQKNDLLIRENGALRCKIEQLQAGEAVPALQQQIQQMAQQNEQHRVFMSEWMESMRRQADAREVHVQQPAPRAAAPRPSAPEVQADPDLAAMDAEMERQYYEEPDGNSDPSSVTLAKGIDVVGKMRELRRMNLPPLPTGKFFEELEDTSG